MYGFFLLSISHHFPLYLSLDFYQLDQLRTPFTVHSLCFNCFFGQLWGYIFVCIHFQYLSSQIKQLYSILNAENKQPRFGKESPDSDIDICTHKNDFQFFFFKLPTPIMKFVSSMYFMLPVYAWLCNHPMENREPSTFPSLRNTWICLISKLKDDYTLSLAKRNIELTLLCDAILKLKNCTSINILSIFHNHWMYTAKAHLLALIYN